MILLLFLACVFGIASAVQINVTDGDNTRVQGGHYAALGQFPWNAAVIEDSTSKFLCSASLINVNHLLTSAECVKEYSFRYSTTRLTGISVHLGTLDSGAVGPGIVCEINSIVIHEKYLPSPKTTPKAVIYHAYNIAVLKNDAGIPISPSIAFISLPMTTEPVEDGTYVQLIGWGGLSNKVNVHLEYGFMSTKNVYTCISEIGENPSVEYYYNLCTPGFQTESGAFSGACHYDNGAGLISDYNTSPLLVGLLSYADCDSTLIRSSIYTSIVAHRDWITINAP